MGYVRAKRAQLSDVREAGLNNLESVVADNYFQSVSERYYNDVVDYPSKLFFVQSRGREDEVVSKLPYLMHFDRHQYLKFAVYLTDVTKDDGPTWVVPGHADKYRSIRRSRTREKLLERGENVLEGLEEGVPLVGAAGTLVIFDTDAPHRVGQLKTGRERKMLRIDTEGRTSSAECEWQRTKGNAIKIWLKGLWDR